MRTAQGLRDDAIDKAELREPVGRERKRFRSARSLPRVLPENGGAAFGRNHRIGRILKHHHDVGHGNRERAARSAFTDHAGDDGNPKPRHFKEIAADGLGLTALLGIDAGIRTRRIDKGDDRKIKLLGKLHEPQGLSVPLGLCHAEIALRAFLKRSPLLVTDHDDIHVGKTRETAHDGLIVRKRAVAVEFMEIREDFIDVVKRIGARRVACDERALPGREGRVDLLDELVFLRFEGSDFALNRYAALRLRFRELAQFINLLLEHLNVVLEFKEYFLGHLFRAQLLH